MSWLWLTALALGHAPGGKAAALDWSVDIHHDQLQIRSTQHIPASIPRDGNELIAAEAALDVQFQGKRLTLSRRPVSDDDGHQSARLYAALPRSEGILVVQNGALPHPTTKVHRVVQIGPGWVARRGDDDHERQLVVALSPQWVVGGQTRALAQADVRTGLPVLPLGSLMAAISGLLILVLVFRRTRKPSGP